MPVSTRRSLYAVTPSPPPLPALSLPQAERNRNGKRARRSLTSLALGSSIPDNVPSQPAKVPKTEEFPTITTSLTTTPATPTTSRQKSTSVPPSTPRARKIVITPGSLTPPKDWDTVYTLVEELRSDRSAPVDTNGSEALPQRHLGDKVFRFQVLIALMLSSQTKDMVVGDAMRALQKHGLTVDKISETPAEVLNVMIHRVGFHNNKTKYIKQVVEVLKEQYDGDIPPSAEEMMKLAGVGPKMAFIVENVAWGKSSGIGVDTHMHRIFNELKWVQSKNPEQTRAQLEGWLPRDKWETINILFVGFGQEVQQFKPKLLEKTLHCSRPLEALRLIQKLGLEYKKEASKAGLEDKLAEVLASTKNVKVET